MIFPTILCFQFSTIHIVCLWLFALLIRSYLLGITLVCTLYVVILKFSIFTKTFSIEF